jgi:riboflavin biosynthesis pyrimidine reductase
MPEETRVKPYVICHMVSSVDGRILPGRWHPQSYGGDLYERLHTQFAAQAWAVGRVTGQEFAKAKAYPAQRQVRFSREPWFARRDAAVYAVVFDAQGKIAWGRSDIGGDPIVAVLAQTVSDDYLAGLRDDKVSYIFAGAGLIDDVSLIVWPAMDGAAGAPSVFDSAAEDAGRAAPVHAMTLLHSESFADGAVWLRYRISY